MYCTNCNRQIDEHAVVCPGCGVPINTVHKFCRNCGHDLPQGAAVCTQCGVPVIHQGGGTALPGQKSKLVAGLLGILLGSLGIHNFYLGFTGKAVAQLLISVLTCGIGAIVSGIWGLVEGIMILTGSMNVDAQGMPLGD